MEAQESSRTDRPAEPKQDKPPDPTLGAKEVEEKLLADQEQGFSGEPVDQTPQENYTLQGVGKGAPTPETERGKSDEDNRLT